MKTLRLFLAVVLAGCGLAVIHAQNLTPADYDKMREILRQKLAGERASAAPAPVAPSAKESTPEAPAPKLQPRLEPATPPPAKAAEAAPAQSSDRLLEALRTAVAKERGIDPSELGVGVSPSASRASRDARIAELLAKEAKEASKTPAPAGAPAVAATPQTPESAPSPAPSKTPAPEVAPSPKDAAMSAPEKPAGPKTRQERLAELLELYKADKVTPQEYHEQRAKILAEP